MLERILNRRNIERAIRAVERNHGAGGVDDLQSDELRPFVNANCQSLLQRVQEGSYKPSPVRKVEIPKDTGGFRMLGIPTVVDRMLQQAMYLVLSPIYEEEFDKHSYGFRPGKNAHQAVKTAQGYLNEGYNWIIELDLEKFFDKVNHQKLMHLLSQKVKDKRTLLLINSYLKSGIMAGGLVSQRVEGTPQGSPLAPRTHPQTLSFLGECRLKEVNFKFDYFIKRIAFMINGKINGTRNWQNVSTRLMLYWRKTDLNFR
jgi:RNA-directed DNA polymerase